MKKIVLTDMQNIVYGYACHDPLATGGAERYQWLLARALAAAGWSVTVGVRDALSANTRETIDGVEFVGMGTSHIVLSWHRFLRCERPDWWFWAMGSHQWGAAVETAKRSGVRTIFSAQFDTDVQPRHALQSRRRWWPLYAWGLLRTDKIFVQHGVQLSGLKPTLRSKASILPGIVLENARHAPHASREGYVAWVGMLRQPKRPDLLVEIARQLPEVKFVACGGMSEHRSPQGYSEQVIERMRRLPNVDFLGQVSHDEASRIIAEASVLLSTSDGEGFPNVFLEAWSNGTPVVSLKIDPDGIIERHGLGILSGTASKAIVDIQCLLKTLELREQIAIKARRYISENHSAPAVVATFERDLP